MPPYDRTPGKVKTRVYTIDDTATEIYSGVQNANGA
jgi:hypothetical protein